MTTAQDRAPLDWPLIAAAFTVVAVNGGFARFAFTPLLPSMAAGLGRSVAAAGVLVTVNLVGYVLGSALSAVLLRRRSAAIVSVAGMAGCAAMMAALAASPSLEVAAIPSFLSGFAGALGFIGMAGVVNGAVTRRRGITMGYATAGMGGGSIVASVLAGILVERGDDGWRLTWAALAVVTAGLAVVAGRVMRARERRHVALPAVAPRGDTRGRGWIFGTYIAFGIGYIIVATYLTTYLQTERGVAPSTAALAFSLTGLAAIVGGPALGRLSDRFGRRGALIGGLALAATGIVLVQLPAGLPVAAMGALLFGVPVTGVASIAAAVVGDSWEPHESASVFGFLTFTFGIAQAAGPSLGALSVIVTGSLDASFHLSVGALTVSALFASRLPDGRATGRRPPAASAGRRPWRPTPRG